MGKQIKLYKSLQILPVAEIGSKAKLIIEYATVYHIG